MSDYDPTNLDPTQPEPAPVPPANPTVEPSAAAAGPYVPPPVSPVTEPLSPADERTWAMLAHFTVLINLFTGFLGPIAAFVIYLAFNNRSRYVAYHALQSAIFQLIWWVGGGAIIGAMWTITGLLSAAIVGLLCIPFAILASIFFGLMPIVALIYGVIAGVQVSQGEDFRYWMVGDWVRNTLTGV